MGGGIAIIFCSTHEVYGLEAHIRAKVTVFVLSQFPRCKD
jgi:hypothetical protein